MTKRTMKSGRSLTRRRLLTAASAGVAGAAAARLAAPWKAGAAPAQIKGTTLRILQWSHFVPAFDAFFDKFVTSWGKENGVTVRVDHIPNLQLPVRIASELAAGAGHDLFQWNGQSQVSIYYPNLVDLSDICEALGKKYGGWLPAANNLGQVGGHWYGFPDLYIPIPMLHRKDLFDENNIKVPDNWEGWRAAGRALKAKGHATGIQISHCNDSNHDWRSVFYDFGVKETDPTGKEVLWDSKELRDAMRFGKAFYEEAMIPEVFSWDDVADNRYLGSGVACFIHDAISAWRSIQGSNEELYKKIWVGPEPTGPRARLNVVDSNVYAIWKFAQNKGAARAFLEFWGAHGLDSVRESKGYNLPFLRAYYKKPMPVLADDINGAPLIQDWYKVAVNFGYPGPITPASTEVNATYLIPDMMGRYVRGGNLEESVKWGMDQVKAIYAKHKS